MRFIVNLPQEELESVERICFQVEEAQWFYEDFVRPLDPNLPSLSLRQFSMKIFQHCPLFSSFGAEVHSKAFSEFLAYKTRVPVRGAILLNEALDQVVLVKGWKKGANWSFPRGKINKDERDIDCAIREVYEETGFDARAAGLVRAGEDTKHVEVTMREQHMKLFVFTNVPMSTHFEPRTRKEISKIQWYKLSDLPTLKRIKQQQQNGAQDALNNPNRFYMVAPFLTPLKRIIHSLRKERSSSQQPSHHDAPAAGEAFDLVGESLSSHDSIPAEGDIVRLMSQLRQSKQACRESNYPEVSSLVDRPRSASMQLKGLLASKMKPVPDQYPNDVALRESKANAILSLLREGSNSTEPSHRQDSPPHTPLEQIHFQPPRPPPSPKPSLVQTAQLASHLQPPKFAASPFLMLSDKPAHQSHQSSLKSVVRHCQSLDPFSAPTRSTETGATGGQLHTTALAPYQRTGDPGFVPQFETSQSYLSMVPPASKLPPPKLSQHTSTLLSLFKTPAHTSAKGNSSTQELSVPTAAGLQYPALKSTAHPHLSSSTPALATPVTALPREHASRSPLQEALLTLFRQPNPSPSLIPPEAPVELSAQGSPTHARVPSIGYQAEKDHRQAHGKSIPNTGHVRESKSTNNSATVTGPLNVPQFERILRRPEMVNSQKAAVSKTAADTHSPAQRPIKILSRPYSAQNLESQGKTSAALPVISNVSTVSRSGHENKSPRATKAPFHPQILKRPESALPVSVNAFPRMVPSPVPYASKLPLRQPADVTGIGRRASQTQEQKSALLALFNMQEGSLVAPLLGKNTSLVSPLSERPPLESELPSPLVLARSRFGSQHEVDSFNTESGKSGTSYAGDKKFLLGFLDDVVKESRK